MPLAVWQGQSTSARKGRAPLPSSLDSHRAGWNAGVAIAIGNGASFGITAGGNHGDGNGEGEATHWRDTHVGDTGSQTTLQSGGLTTLRGAQVQGKGIDLDAAALQIASLQDTSRYQRHDESGHLQLTVGYGFSASGGYRQSDIDADHASVTRQSGLFAGDASLGKQTTTRGRKT